MSDYGCRCSVWDVMMCFNVLRMEGNMCLCAEVSRVWFMVCGVVERDVDVHEYRVGVSM